MNIAVIGTGGREHAIAVKCLRSDAVRQVHVIPGNSGMLMTSGLSVLLDWDGSFNTLETYLRKQDIDLVIVGNEAYLKEGIVDWFSHRGIRIFGPAKAAAKLEYSKDFAKRFMDRHHIPTATYHTCTDLESATAFLNTRSGMIVVKQDGLALGKGVLVTEDPREAASFLQESFKVGSAVVFEEFLEGQEFSLLAFVNRDYYNLMIPARDYKRAYDNDMGLNTGGMGAYTPVEYVDAEVMAAVEETIVKPTIAGLAADGIEFTGILYFGLMKTADGVKVIEYNTRFGDPEAEVLLEAMESDLVQAIDAALSKKRYPLAWKPGVTLGVCLASQGYPAVYDTGRRIQIPEGLNCYAMALEKHADRYASTGGRVAFVVSSGDDMEKARAACYANLQRIACEGFFYRTDIGC